MKMNKISFKKIYLALGVSLILFTMLIGCTKVDDSTKSSLFLVDSKEMGYKNIDIQVKEIERSDKKSIVHIYLNEGSSVDSSMFIAGSLVELTKIRGFEYYAILNEQDSEDYYIYVIGFLDSGEDNIRELFGDHYYSSEPKIIDINDNTNKFAYHSWKQKYSICGQQSSDNKEKD